MVADKGDRVDQHKGEPEHGNRLADEARHHAYHHHGLSPLAHHSASNRYMTSAEWLNNAEQLRLQGDHLVSNTDTPESIAKQWLQMRGQPTDRASVEQEWQRIVNLPENARYGLAHNPRGLQSNMILQVWGPDVGPKDMTCQYKPWQMAEGHATTVVQKCGQMLTPKDSDAILILQPGSRGALNSGTAAFVAPGAEVRDAAAGSLIINAGGTYRARPGADVIEVPAKRSTTNTTGT
jgi:hypothetical protein